LSTAEPELNRNIPLLENCFLTHEYKVKTATKLLSISKNCLMWKPRGKMSLMEKLFFVFKILSSSQM
jgi:hypothetical protein